jgi:hypothetical protein
MTEAVLEMVALIFEGIESFAFNFPTGTTGFNQPNDVLFAHRLVGHPAVMIGHFLINSESILKETDLIRTTGAV